MRIIHRKNSDAFEFRDIAVGIRIFFIHIKQRQKICFVRLHITLPVIMIAGCHDHFDSGFSDF